MKKYICTACEWVYDPAVGDPDGGIARAFCKNKNLDNITCLSFHSTSCLSCS